MSTVATHYVILGIKVPFSDVIDPKTDDMKDELRQYQDDPYQEEITAVDGLTLVSDGMSGEYAVFGKVLAKGSEFDGIDMTEITVDEVQAITYGIDLPRILGTKNWDGNRAKIFAFTHWH
jgi:hypothetical protein